MRINVLVGVLVFGFIELAAPVVSRDATAVVLDAEYERLLEHVASAAPEAIVLQRKNLHYTLSIDTISIPSVETPTKVFNLGFVVVTDDVHRAEIVFSDRGLTGSLDFVTANDVLHAPARPHDVHAFFVHLGAILRALDETEDT